jgi:hypothetical protein
MTIKTTKLGPGSLTLGAGALAVASQLRSAKVVPAESVETTDDIKVLSGETLTGDETVDFTYTLSGTFLLDLDANGVVDWSWDNRGTSQPFVFTPNTADGAIVSGNLKPVPIAIGADEIDARMEQDFTWRIVGTPTFTPS